MSDTALALHQLQSQLDTSEMRFNALAQVAGREMPKVLKRPYTVPLTIAVGAGGAFVEAKFGTKGTIVNSALALAGWVVGIMSSENPDMREGAYALATGLGTSVASINTYDKVTTMMAAKTAPAPAPAPAA